MHPDNIPLILDDDDIPPLLHTDGIVIVDLSGAAAYAAGHVPGAIHVDAAGLTTAEPPVMGLMPSETAFGDLLSGAGITPESHVIAYDGENNLKACRFLWTLDVAGHRRFSLLNGGLRPWVEAGRPLETDAPKVERSQYPVQYGSDHVADKRYVLEHYQDRDVTILDARSELEYTGVDSRAARAGHIPGAANVDWLRTVYGGGDFRFKPVDELRALYFKAGVSSDNEVIVHCHSHMRSAHSYILLKALGFRRLKGYPGSWSDWGNDPETPVAH